MHYRRDRSGPATRYTMNAVICSLASVKLTAPPQQCEELGQHHGRGSPDFETVHVKRRNRVNPSITCALGTSKRAGIGQRRERHLENPRHFTV